MTRLREVLVRSMVIGMATMKVTVTLDVEQLAQVRALVAAGTSPTVSAFVKHAVGIALLDAAGWSAMLAESVENTGGPLTARERKWADGVLGAGGRKVRRGRTAA